MIEKKHLKHVTHRGRVGLGVANSWVGLKEVYSKTAIFKFRAHVTYETLESSKEIAYFK